MPTASDARQNASLLGARICTSHGESSPSTRDIHEHTSSRYVSTNAYVRFATPSSSIEYANAGQASWKATMRKAITDAIRTASEYTPTSACPLNTATKKRSMKLIAQSASADGTRGSPNLFIARSSLRSNSRPSWYRRYASSAKYTTSVPMKLPTTAPVAPL